MPSIPHCQRAHIAMLVFTFLISTSFTVGRRISPELDPLVITLLRFCLALVLFALIAVVRREKMPELSALNLARYAWLAGLLIGYFVLMFEALRWTTALNTSAVFTLAPVITAVVSWYWLGQRLSNRQTVSLAVAAAGAIWVVFEGDWQNLINFSIGKGELIFFAAAFAYACYSPSVRRLHGAENLVVLTLMTLAVGVVMLLIISWRELWLVDWAAVPAIVWLGVVHLAVFTTAVSFFLMQYGSLHLPSALVMAYVYLIPAFVVAQNALISQVFPPPGVMLGVLVIAAALFIVQRDRSAG